MANLNKIKQITYSRGLQLKDVATECNITPAALTAMIKSGTTTVQTLERIAAFLDVPVSTFFDDLPTVTVNGSRNNTAVQGNIHINDTRRAIEILHEQLGVKDNQINELIKALQK